MQTNDGRNLLLDKKCRQYFFRRSQKSQRKLTTCKQFIAAGEYIQKHFREKLSIQSIAEVVHLSPSYLSHIFSQTFGYTITDYVTYIRLENAKSILSKSGTSISEAALDSGFEDISYFSRVFKKVEGISPREYKKRQLP